MKKFSAYMKLHNYTDRSMAARVGVSSVSIMYWRLGRRVPTIAFALKIERATKGAVTVYDWK